MKEVIKVLSSDHEIIAGKIKVLQSLIDMESAERFPKIQEVLIFFEDFLFKSHHIKEEQVLYAWMVGQNERSDSELIKKIIDDHNSFHQASRELTNNIDNFINKRTSPTEKSILFDLSEFIANYIDHMESEESFIYEIASSLKISIEEEEKLLKKLIL